MLKNSKVFYNNTINKKELKKIIDWAFKLYGPRKAAYLIDQLKEIGFEYATKSGLSIGLEDLKVPPIKNYLIKNASHNVYETELEVNRGEINEVERFQKIIYIWNNTSEDLKERVINYFKNTDPLNSVYIMAFSGARGNISQVRQLVGMRGLMADPNGQIIDLPIQTNFREGLSITDYIISSYGARKGLVDTAIKTADSGYLTRRLVEIAQSIIICELDCNTEKGLEINDKNADEEIISSFKERSIGRLLAKPIIYNNEIIASKNEQITASLIEKLIQLNIHSFIIRSPLTCECRRALCQKCYGLNLASNELVNLGESVGILAAQSIGEPGTQLTMRTFHTGGVFTSELTRQIRAEYSGYVCFDANLKVRFFRTNYGKNAYISENESYINLYTYNNDIKPIKIIPETIILISNNTFIKRSDILFELPSRTLHLNESNKEIKFVLAKLSGEIILENKNLKPQYNNNTNNLVLNSKSIFWVLSGQVYPIPFDAKLKKCEFTKIFKNQSIAQTKIYTTRSGFVNYFRNSSNNEIQIIKIINSYKSFDNFKIFIEKNNSHLNKCLIYLSNIHNILLKLEPFTTKKFLFGYLENKNYKTQTGGVFYITDFNKIENLQNILNLKKNNSKFEIKPGCTVFYIPESTIPFNGNIQDLKFKTGNFISKHTEIFPNYFTNLSGFLEIHSTDKDFEIKVIPGNLYILNNIPINIKNIEELNEQVFFPGEILFQKYTIKRLSYLKIFKTSTGIAFYLKPIIRYEITKEKMFKNFGKNYFMDNNFTIENFSLNITSGIELKTNNPIQFIKFPIIINYSFNSNSLEMSFNFKKPKNQNSWCGMTINYSKILLIDSLIPTELKKNNVSLNVVVEKKQFVEPYTILAFFDIITLFTNFIYSIQEKLEEKNRRILLTTQKDYKTIYLDDFNNQLKQNQFIRLGQKIGNNLVFQESGLIEKVSGNIIKLRLGQPYLFSNEARLRKNPGDFIQEREIFGELIYQRLKTGDIVQGLPRVEELLEARNPKNQAILSKRPGIITKIKCTSEEIVIWTRPTLRKDYYIIPNSERLLIKLYNYINVGEPLTEGTLNPHNLLHIYFQYFCSLGTLTMYEAAYISFKKIQVLLLNSIQSIYFSQGVIISDKHLEIIIREMTKKVQVEYPGDTNFLPGDFLDLEQVNYINSSLKNKKKILFYPIILGITKAALQGDGFLAAASFQETTKVLTQAAVQGKTDWLRGLKENIITGRLMPAGTGFYMNKDLSFNNTILLNSNSNNNIDVKTFLKLKHKQLKQKIKIKFNK
ncbi:unnamed protein product [Discosporangium mesarthrocarpum]